MTDYLDEIELLSDIYKGKEQAYTYVFDMYYESLVNYAWRITKDTELAQDIVQAVFCKLYESRKTLAVYTSFKVYIYKAVYNRCLNEIKHRKIVACYEDKELMDFYFKEIVETPEAEMSLRYNDIKQYVNEAIETLPEKCKVIYKLSRYEDLSYQEIAERLCISVKTVETQMSRALAKLRVQLEWLLSLMVITYHNFM